VTEAIISGTLAPERLRSKGTLEREPEKTEARRTVAA
jgi:hypothetical protein